MILNNEKPLLNFQLIIVKNKIINGPTQIETRAET